jgi:hypothetical protein
VQASTADTWNRVAVSLMSFNSTSKGRTPIKSSCNTFVQYSGLNCYNMSGSFRTDYHIDFPGSTTGTADSSSGSAQLIIWRTRRHQAEDNATIRRHGRRTTTCMRGVGCWGAMSTTLSPVETGCSGVALGFSSDDLQGRPRGYSGNGHIQRSFQYAVWSLMGLC